MFDPFDSVHNCLILCILSDSMLLHLFTSAACKYSESGQNSEIKMHDTFAYFELSRHHFRLFFCPCNCKIEILGFNEFDKFVKTEAKSYEDYYRKQWNNNYHKKLFIPLIVLRIQWVNSFVSLVYINIITGRFLNLLTFLIFCIKNSIFIFNALFHFILPIIIIYLRILFSLILIFFWGS